jgi:glucosyl-dolichyl phosphate glucuronosyltransferase
MTGLDPGGNETIASAAVAAACPAISVCVCTCDRPHYLRSCLEGLAAQTAAPHQFEILVVDSGSCGDAPAAIAAMVAEVANARLVRLETPGVSAARNAGARAARGEYVAYIDDDAIPARNWVEAIRTVIAESDRPPAVLGGRVLPIWEQPLPAWWPERLRGVLSIIEWEGRGEYRTPEVPPTLEPYAVNMVVHRKSVLEIGGFDDGLGRVGGLLLSDEEVQLAWKLQDRGCSARYDSRITVHHQIQADRFHVRWLLLRLYMQGVSTVITRRLLGQERSVWVELPRRILVALMSAPCASFDDSSTRFLELRWRLAYALGFVRGTLGWRPGEKARLFNLICRPGGRS